MPLDLAFIGVNPMFWGVSTSAPILASSFAVGNRAAVPVLAALADLRDNEGKRRFRQLG